jgi:hypothetical protein
MLRWWFTGLACGMVALTLAMSGRTQSTAVRFTSVTGGIQDNVTGLLWQQPLSAGTYTFSGAQTYCASLGSGWRAPSMKEVQTIIDRNRSNPPLDPIFGGTPVVEFWTSSQFVKDASKGWRIHLGAGGVSPQVASMLLPVRCVR